MVLCTIYIIDVLIQNIPMSVLVFSITSVVSAFFPFLSDCDHSPTLPEACHVVTERPDVDELPLLSTYYNPLLGGINCAADCSALADGLGWSESDFGRVAACPRGWHYQTVIFGSYELLCRDRGGMIDCLYNEFYRQWVCHVDVLARGIDCNYCLWWDWKRVRR